MALLCMWFCLTSILFWSLIGIYGHHVFVLNIWFTLYTYYKTKTKMSQLRCCWWRIIHFHEGCQKDVKLYAISSYTCASWTKLFVFWFKFHWKLFPWIQLTLSLHAVAWYQTNIKPLPDPKMTRHPWHSRYLKKKQIREAMSSQSVYDVITICVWCHHNMCMTRPIITKSCTFQDNTVS